MNLILISNNPLVWEKYPEAIKVEGNFKDVLIRTRDEIHLGQQLLTHPLTGSIKPNQTPYKSIVLAKGQSNTIDLQSLQLIEDAIGVAAKFGLARLDLSEAIRRDFQVIDLSFMDSAWDSLAPLGIANN